MPMVRTRRRRNTAIEPTHRLLQPGQRLLRLIRQQIHQRRRRHLLGADLAIAFEAVPVGVAECKARGEGLGQFLGGQIGDR
jgi:hypothetical protein